MSLIQQNEFHDMIASIATVLGLPWVLYLFWRNVREHQLARENAVYEKISAQWWEYLTIAISSPKVGVTFDELEIDAAKLGADQKVVQDMLFELKTTMFENAFVAYRNASSIQRKQQWRGWDEYITNYCRRSNYRKWWSEIHQDGATENSQYDDNFDKYLLSKFRSYLVVENGVSDSGRRS